jgi:hypothetical protein
MLIGVVLFLLSGANTALLAQAGPFDTIRLGATIENGVSYPMAFLPEFTKVDLYIDADARLRRDRLRRDIYIAYPYAITAAAILNNVYATLDTLERRRDRKHYLRQVDRELDATFKEPLKNLSVDQGHVLVKLINRQTGRNCYSIIRELKGGFNAVIWQSVGVLFNNNLRHEYDPEGKDKELESLVQVLEGSSNYRYQLYLQQEMMKKIPRTVSRK